jgi:hypothetical protein
MRPISLTRRGSEVKTVPYYNLSTKNLVWINADIDYKINDPTVLLPIVRRFLDAHQEIIDGKINIFRTFIS